MLALLLTILCTLVHARGETGEEDALAAIELRQAPLSLSADGHWRLYVDAKDVLHRTNLAEPGLVGGSVNMLPGVHMLSASRSGQKVAFTTAGGCIGLVDFGNGPGSAPKTTWQPMVGEYLGQPAVAAPAVWLDAPPVPCAQPQLYGMSQIGHQTVALSSNGRLLATRDQVIDTESHRIVATLPPSREDIGRRYVLRLRFVDHDTKLLVLWATLGEGYESLGGPSDLRVAVWDLATHSLYNLASQEGAVLQAPQALFSDFSSQTNVFTWVDTARFRKSRVAQGEREPPFDAVQLRLGTCGAAPVVRFPVFAFDWTEMVVDPWGRWVAATQRLDAQLAEGAKPDGFVERLVVMDIASRRVISATRFAHELHGLVAAPDGATIYALAAPDSRPPAGAKAERLASDLLEVKIDLAQLTTPRLAASPWDAAACRLEDEAPGARASSRQDRALQAAWSRSHESATNKEGDAAAPFVMRDGTVWLDQGATIAQIDPATGHTLRTLPTPRSTKVSSVPVPMADGFVNAQDDTLSWRPFDASVPGAPARRVIDVRRGWTVGGVKPLARSVLAVWYANAGTPVRKPTDDSSESVVVALYDAASGKRLHDYPQDGDAYAEEGDESTPHWLPSLLPRCEDEQGPVRSGTDWRIGPFDSLRATACGDKTSGTRTVAWFGLDIAPRAAVTSFDADQSRALTIDGGIATATDGFTIRIFDIAARREIGQIALAPTDFVTWTRVLAERSLVLVDTSSSAPDAQGHTLRAFPFR